MQKTTPIFRSLLMVFATSITLSLSAQISLTATAATTSGSYSTLKAAFDAINAGTHKGDIFITVTGNTTETATATLNASGSGSANYASLVMQPGGGSDRTISGNINGGIITLNGADNVTINGLNSGGNTLTIENSNTGTSASAIIFTNSASNNLVSECSIYGSNASTTTYTNGVITFLSGSNTNDQITHCNIGPSGTNMPSRCIVSGGGTNTDITVDHCNIYGFSGGAGTGINDRHSAIYLYYGTSSNWTITNNSMYQTSSINLASAGIISVIYIRSGDGYTINNNYIGGTQAQCGGTAMTYTGDIKEFYGIELGDDVGNLNLNTINYNTIKNISMSSSNTSASTNNSVPRFSTIQVRKGKVTLNYNTIGSDTENGSIALTQTNTTFSLYYFLVPLAYSNFVVNVTNCNYNTIAGIDVSATNFDAYGVHMESYTGNSIDSFSYNRIGSLSVANSISIAKNTTSVTRNTFTAVNASSIVLGANVISNNLIANISRGNSSSSDAMYGILSYMDSAVITQNHVANLGTDGTGSVYGIYASYSPNQTISNNFIHGLGCSGNSSNNVYGIYNDYSGSNGPIYNNIVVLGKDRDGNSYTNCPFVGIGHSNATNIYFNTVYIDGTTTGKSSYAYYEYFNSSTRIILNNIFFNARSNTSGTAKHYSAYFYSTTGLSTDYNDYIASGTGGVLGYLGADKTTLANLKSATGQDANSLNFNPNFISGGSFISNDYMCKLYLQGTNVAGFTSDYNLLSRGATPMMGAFDGYYWKGDNNTNFSDAGNWIGGSVPPDHAYVIFDLSPNNHCQMDANHIVGGIINEQANFGFDLAGYELSLSGDLTLNGGAIVFANAAGSKLNLIGSDTQSLPAGAFYLNTINDLEINNPYGVEFNEADTISGTLTMTQGDIRLNGNTLFLGNSTSNAGTLSYTSGRIYGTFTRWYDSVTNSGNTGLFPLGYNNYDRFVTVEYSSAPTSGGTLTATFSPYSMGTNGIPIYNVAAAGGCSSFDITETSSEGFWIMTPANGLSGGQYDITLVGQGLKNINSICELSAIKRVGTSPWFESGNQVAPTGTLSRPVVKRTSASGWSNWGFGGGIINPLPVKFIQLNAECKANGTLVEWATADEEAGIRFEIEISEDGKSWTVARKVDAQGLRFASYSIQLNEKVKFIRIAEITTNGSRAYSSIAGNQCAEANQGLSVYPNPVTDVLKVSGHEDLGQIQILDIMGKEVMSFNSESSSVSINTAELPAGVYSIRIGEQTLRFIKQ